LTTFCPIRTISLCSRGKDKKNFGKKCPFGTKNEIKGSKVVKTIRPIIVEKEM
jgi:hypothetical protein